MSLENAETRAVLDNIEAALKVLIPRYDDAQHDNVLTDLVDALQAIRNAQEALEFDGRSDQFEPWPDNLPLEEQVERLAAVLLADYEHTFDRSEGAMEKAARILWESAHFDGLREGGGHVDILLLAQIMREADWRYFKRANYWENMARTVLDILGFNGQPDPSPASLVADPAMLTTLITSGSKVPPPLDNDGSREAE